MGKIIFIAGPPAIGKRYIAKELSQATGISWISVEEISQMMKGNNIKSQNKQEEDDDTESEREVEIVKFDSEGQPPPHVFRKLTAEERITYHRETSEEVWKDVLAFIKKNDLIDSYIIVGAWLLPHLIQRDFKDNKNTHALFFYDSNDEHLKNIAKVDKVWDQNGRKRGWTKEQEQMLDIEWVMAFNNWLRSELLKYRYPKIDLSQSGKPLEEIVKFIS